MLLGHRHNRSKLGLSIYGKIKKLHFLCSFGDGVCQFSTKYTTMTEFS